jgi:L-threonylcarbamoyladenylate synthase
MKSKYIDFRNEQNYEELKAPAEAIKQGKLVLFPTETVYGIGANALDEEAVKKIYIAKGRASDNPLIAHIANLEMLKKLVMEVGKVEEKLIEKFWPGPLTIVFKKKTVVPDVITGGLDTVAIRMPSDIIAHKLIEYSNCPIAAPSANISGKPSGTQVEDVIGELDGKVEYVIDGGKVDIGVESTVIRVIDGVVHILRPGKVTPEDIENLGIPVYIEKQILGEYKEGEKVMSPGIKYKHYAPNTKCVLVYSEENSKMVEKINELAQNKKTVVICKTRKY